MSYNTNELKKEIEEFIIKCDKDAQIASLKLEIIENNKKIDDIKIQNMKVEPKDDEYENKIYHIRGDSRILHIIKMTKNTITYKNGCCKQRQEPGGRYYKLKKDIVWYDDKIYKKKLYQEFDEIFFHMDKYQTSTEYLKCNSKSKSCYEELKQ